MKPTCRISWAGNFLTSDLTFGPSFKVKQWFTGFGEFSFMWIKICISFPMRRSTCILHLYSTLFDLMLLFQFRLCVMPGICFCCFFQPTTGDRMK